jgi:hypothetical protein
MLRTSRRADLRDGDTQACLNAGRNPRRAEDKTRQRRVSPQHEFGTDRILQWQR